MTHIVKEGQLLKLPEVQEPYEGLNYCQCNRCKEIREAYNNWINSGITISKDLKLDEGKQYEAGVDFKIYQDCTRKTGECSFKNDSCKCWLAVSTELKNEDGVIEKRAKKLMEQYEYRGWDEKTNLPCYNSDAVFEMLCNFATSVLTKEENKGNDYENTY